ncbi:UDP-Gal or UDP-GlcNAc-dependent glycosyltransferase [Trypanosoma theileri]|uniref:Hexosyltransferase n=1 Tax=Trypanosoma theileri TaxID=67003 RepID=A0A1X0NQJ2_9TRYP|nr:UDP-Gal or UDP-GlcNAc-dependent glycosyltransferase [Trypanosoma theileri]ORC86788.1 UDP-Gal or UDP-GlcNAc-dependent glycosyltransferase [Trypanosoma theileri]
MLVLYVLARHPSQGYNYSAALEKEADEYHDVITLPVNEGNPNTTKLEYSSNDWGLDAQMGMSRKTFLWFELALQVFPNVSCITKGDDDMFLRVPQFLSDLRVIPLRGIYWGVPVGGVYYRKSVNIGIRFAGGWCYTLSRYTAEHFVSYEPLKRLVHLLYSKEREEELFLLSRNGEDAIVASILFVESPYAPLVFVTAYTCRFHDIRNSTGHSLLNPMSLGIHHLQEDDYAMLMDRFGNGTTYSPRVRIFRKRKMIKFLC